MKKLMTYAVALTFISFTWLTSCKKDEPAPVIPTPPPFSLENIEGTWKITVSEGTEWEEGVADPITPRAPEPDLLNATLKIIGTEIQVRDSGGTLLGAFPISTNDDDLTVTITGVGTFDVSDYIGDVSMQWDQELPDEHSDYEENNPGQFLYFQKFWTLVKQP